MIKIRLTGTRDELTRAFAITRQGYKVVSRSKPHKAKSDEPTWSISINAEIKALDAAVKPALSKGQRVRKVKQTERDLDKRSDARMEDEGNLRR